jgi:hypothetical protein
LYFGEVRLYVLEKFVVMNQFFPTPFFDVPEIMYCLLQFIHLDDWEGVVYMYGY